MKPIQIAALAVIAVFYIAYFTKMILQRRKGVKTDQIGKGSKPRRVLVIEILMKIATYSVVVVEVISIIMNFRMWKSSYAWIGIGVAALGVLVFIVAMVTMRNSWRAGIPEKDKTELVTTGIYRISRNPAFLGFDLMYIGLLIAFFNYLHLLFVLYAIVMLHLQILQEEKFLTATFGEGYSDYKKTANRYFGRKIKSKKKAIQICGIVLGLLLILVASLYGYYKLCMDPYRGTVQNFAASMEMDKMLSGEEAKADLGYLMERLRERHPAWLDGSGKDVLVEAQYEKELATIGDKISVLEFYQSASRITAALHDGHTYVNWYHDGQARYIDDFTVIRDYGTPLTIDGAPSEEVLAAYKEVSSYEVDYYADAQFWENVILYEPSLRLCGVDTSDGVVMTFNAEGTEAEYHFDFVPLNEVNGYQPGDGENKWVFYEIDKENSVGIFTLTSCVCNEEYYNVLDSFFEEVFAEGIENVVVDLRGNGGGNSLVANEFIKYLNVDEYQSWDSAVRFGWYLLRNENISYTNQKKEQVFDGAVYVLTDTWTYSSAMDFAMLIADNDLGTIVGQPSGNLPDSYGDCLFFQMPNSRLVISVSYKRWYRIDQTKAGEPIMPDVEVASGEALEKVYELIRDNP